MKLIRAFIAAITSVGFLVGVSPANAYPSSVAAGLKAPEAQVEQIGSRGGRGGGFSRGGGFRGGFSGGRGFRGGGFSGGRRFYGGGFSGGRRFSGGGFYGGRRFGGGRFYGGRRFYGGPRFAGGYYSYPRYYGYRRNRGAAIAGAVLGLGVLGGLGVGYPYYYGGDYGPYDCEYGTLPGNLNHCD